MPITETLAISPVTETSQPSRDLQTSERTFSAFLASSLETVNVRFALPPLPIFWTIISTTIPASPSSRKISAAVPGLSGRPDSVTFVWFLSIATPLITTSSNDGDSDFTIVPGSLLKLDLTSNTTLCFCANSTLRACITFDPKDAISKSSSYDICGIFLAFFTTRGSAVNTPLTSV